MKRIITIGREFGAGGGELGRRLAREMNIAYYDRDIILKTAKASAHLTPEQVRRWDRARTPRVRLYPEPVQLLQPPLERGTVGRPGAGPSGKLRIRRAVLSSAAMQTISCGSLTTACGCLYTLTATGVCCICVS